MLGVAARSLHQNPSYSTHAPNRHRFYKRRVLRARESHEESESSKKKISGVPELPLNQKFRILSASWEYQNPPSRTPMPPAAPAQQKAHQESPPLPCLPVCFCLLAPPLPRGGGGGVSKLGKSNCSLLRRCCRCFILLADAAASCRGCRCFVLLASFRRCFFVPLSSLAFPCGRHSTCDE